MPKLEKSNFVMNDPAAEAWDARAALVEQILAITRLQLLNPDLTPATHLAINNALIQLREAVTQIDAWFTEFAGCI